MRLSDAQCYKHDQANKAKSCQWPFYCGFSNFLIENFQFSHTIFPTMSYSATSGVRFHSSKLEQMTRWNNFRNKVWPNWVIHSTKAVSNFNPWGRLWYVGLRFLCSIMTVCIWWYRIQPRGTFRITEKSNYSNFFHQNRYQKMSVWKSACWKFTQLEILCLKLLFKFQQIQVEILTITRHAHNRKFTARWHSRPVTTKKLKKQNLTLPWPA